MHKILISLGALIFCVPLFGKPISFAYVGHGSGSLGETRFEKTKFIIAVTSDTDYRKSTAYGWMLPSETARLEIPALSLSAEFDLATENFVNNTNKTVGFGFKGADFMDFTIANSELNTWDMLSSVGPFYGRYLSWFESLGPVPTTLGGFSIDHEHGREGVYQVTVSP